MKRFGLRSLLALAVVLAMAVTAWAFYSTSGAGAGGGTVGTMTAPVMNQPTSPSSGSVPLSWSAAQLSDESLESQITYSVQRNDGGGWVAADAVCTDISTTSCTDEITTSGSYTYRVIAEFRSWTATSDPTTDAVEVTVGGGDTQAPELTKLEMFDTNGNGKVDEVLATFDEALESSTATEPWTLANVPSGGSLSSVSTSGTVATLVISEGAGAPNTAVGSFTVALDADPNGIRDAAGNESSFAAQGPDDSAAPIVTSINRTGASPTNAASLPFAVSFSESVTGVDATDFQLVTTGTATGSIGAPSGSGASYTLNVNSVAGDGTIGLNLVDDGSIFDTASPGNQLGGAGITNGNFTGQVYDVDRVAPQLVSLEMRDNNANGKVDRVVATFDETLASSTTHAPWELANVPSGGTKGALSTSGSTATLLIAEGAGAHNTAVGSFTVALAQNATGIRDAFGNQSSFAAQAPTDDASPVPITLTDTDGSINGRFQMGDSAILTFSENVTNSQTSSNVAVSDPPGPGNDSWAAPGFLNDTGKTTLGRDDYVQGNNREYEFPGSALDQPATNAVRLTLSACDTGTDCGDIRTAAAAGNVAVTPSTTIADAAGNTALPRSDATTFSILLF